MAYLRDAAARYNDWRADLGGFDDHFTGQATCNVKNLVETIRVDSGN